MLINFISIDPSGTGETGLYNTLTDSAETFKSENWKEHYNWILDKFEKWSKILEELPLWIIIENVKNLYQVNKDTLDLLRLLGALDLRFQLMNVYSDVVKRKAKWFKDIQLNLRRNKNGSIYYKDKEKVEFCNKTNITFSNNKYYYKGKIINVHERDAILIYHIGLDNKEKGN